MLNAQKFKCGFPKRTATCIYQEGKQDLQCLKGMGFDLIEKERERERVYVIYLSDVKKVDYDHSSSVILLKSTALCFQTSLEFLNV